MRKMNPLEMNDWGIKKFLKVVLAIHLLMWIAIGLDAAGLHIPFITEVIGFIYLTFVPGLLILRIIRLHKLGSIKTLLFSVGLSIAFTMLIGLLIDAVYPLIGISRPLSTIPIVITFSVLTLALSALSYIKDKDFSEPSYIEVREFFTPPALFLLLLLPLSILGALLVRYYQTNVLLLSSIAIIALIVALVALNRFIEKKYYPLAVFVIAIAILYHIQLSFSYLFGTDVQSEYYVFRLTALNSYWGGATPMMPTYGSMLSLTILPTAYSRLLAMDGLWVFKLVYPLFASLIPLGLYEVFRRSVSEKVAFLSSFFFMSFTFFLVALSYALRMEVAELFFMLLIMLILAKKLDLTKRAALFIIFSFSLVVSHYGLAYYYIFYILIAWLFLFFTRRLMKENTMGEMLTATGIMLCLVATLMWYMYVSNAVIFRASVGVGEFVWGHLSDIFTLGRRDPQLLQGLGLLPIGQVEHTVWREVAGWFNRIATLLIIIGVFRFIVKRREMRFAPEYIGLALAGLITMLAAMIIPGFSYAVLNTARIYHFALFFLSPFCILGGEAIFVGIKRLFRRTSGRIKNDAVWRERALPYIALLILIPYFLFNIGFIFEVTGDAPGSGALGLERLKATTNVEVKAGLYNSYMIEEDVSGIGWLSDNRSERSVVYSDKSATYFVLPGYSLIEPENQRTLYRVTGINEEAYIFLRYFNTTEGLMVGLAPVKILGYGNWMRLYDAARISPLLDKSSLIYSNGGSEIYYTNP